MRRTQKTTSAGTRNIGAEILEGLQEAVDYLDGNAGGLTETRVVVPAAVDVKALRSRLRLTQAEFARRYALPLQTLRKWERGERQPDSASRAYLTVIAKDPDAVAQMLTAA
jgi:putative transcriptional regulator